MDENKKKEAYRVGVFVFVILAVLTIGEFAISTIASVWWQPLILIAGIKAWLIIRDYMHFPRLFAEEEEVAE
jgi:hypothetical protein